MDYFATEFYDRKDALVIAEMQILKRLGFQTQTGLPYGHLVNYLQVLELAEDNAVVARCWGYVNDLSVPPCPFFSTATNPANLSSLQTPVPALYPQSTIAVAAIYLAARRSSPPLALPLSPVPWWTLFDASEEDVLQICETLLVLYRDWDANSVWARAGALPVDKAGVRSRLVPREGAERKEEEE